MGRGGVARPCIAGGIAETACDEVYESAVVRFRAIAECLPLLCPLFFLRLSNLLVSSLRLYWHGKCRLGCGTEVHHY